MGIHGGSKQSGFAGRLCAVKDEKRHRDESSQFRAFVFVLGTKQRKTDENRSIVMVTA
jgi:hypothetical protein